MDIELPEETLYIIDKIVRLRARTGRFGFDHSEVINCESEDINLKHSQHVKALHNGECFVDLPKRSAARRLLEKLENSRR